MKKVILVVVLAIVVLFIVMVSKDLKENPIERQEEEKIDLILDASKYARISTDNLIDILGKAKSKEKWNNENSKGTFSMMIYSYDIDGMTAEFITYENLVVKIRCFATTPWELPDNFETVFKMFNITLNDHAKKTVDNGLTVKYSPVADSVAEFEVYNIDSEKSTFDTVYITYNLNYFD